MNAFLPDETRLTHVHLRVASLERALGFYRDVLGFTVLSQSARIVKLGTTGRGPELLTLTEVPGTVPRPARATGLYHFAIRYPQRRDLAEAYRGLLRSDYPLSGAADHAVSEALYLNDPDGNGVELCADRLPQEWVWQDGQVLMTTKPLDLKELARTKRSDAAPLPAATSLGHIHLHVADLAAAERFFHDYLGLAVTQRAYPGAVFLAAGDYHHHVAINLWAGKAAPPANAAGLISYRFEVSVPEILYCLGHRAPLLGYETESTPGVARLRIRDPNGAWLEIQPSKTSGSRLVGCGEPGGKAHLHVS